MMACLPEADAVERAMLTALDRTVRAQLGVDRLSLIDADGVELLRFLPAVAPPLVGTEWVAIGINNGRGGVVSALEGSRVTANFDDEGRVAGSEAATDSGHVRSRRRRDPDRSGGRDANDVCRTGGGLGAGRVVLRRAGASVDLDDSGGRLQLRDADDALQVDFRGADSA